MAAAALALAGRGDEIARALRRRAGARRPSRRCSRAASTAPRDEQHGPLVRRGGRPARRARGACAFEGQAAMLLEGLAERHGAVAADPSLFAITADDELDLAPLVARLADERDAALRRGALPRHARRGARRLGRARPRAARASPPSPAAAAASSTRSSRAACARALARARHRDARSAGGAAERRRPRARPGVGRAAVASAGATDHVPRHSRPRRRAGRAGRRADRPRRRAEGDLARAGRRRRASATTSSSTSATRSTRLDPDEARADAARCSPRPASRPRPRHEVHRRIPRRRARAQARRARSRARRGRRAATT